MIAKMVVNVVVPMLILIVVSSPLTLWTLPKALAEDNGPLHAESGWTARDLMDAYARKAPGSAIDNVTNFVFETPISKSILDYPDNLQAAASENLPWNDYYWPTYSGRISYRYRDADKLPQSRVWLEHYTYYLANPPADALNDAAAMAHLSPAEKYDILIGNETSWTLTNFNWDEGRLTYDQGKKVGDWWGLCHGWAGASHMMTPYPFAGVEAIGVTGRRVYFSPTDLRALETYLWSESQPPIVAVGDDYKKSAAALAGSKNPDPACIDVNPKSWHLALLNRVGRDGDSMVMDSSYDQEVWNFAVDSYYLRYFNPKTLRTFRSWKEALVERTSFTNDPFRATRVADTRYLLGVTVEVFYPTSIKPFENTNEKRLYRSIRFTYDLELDKDLNIIGGEWHSQKRPDFVWTFAKGAQAQAEEDSTIAGPMAWVPKTPLPADWASKAQTASQRGQVLYSIIQNLVTQSLGTVPAQDAGEDVAEQL